MFLQNVGIYPWVYIASQPRRTSSSGHSYFVLFTKYYWGY
jgi:hypothetical protein